MSDRDTDFADYAQGRWSALVRAAILLGSDAYEAEDLAQAALIKTWSNWSRVKRAAEPDAYVYRILVNTISTGRKRRWNSETPTAELPERRDQAVIETFEGVDLRGAVLAALRELPPNQRQVLVLRFVADLTERATAETLGIALGTVKSRTARALASLDTSHFADFVGDDA